MRHIKSLLAALLTAALTVGCSSRPAEKAETTVPPDGGETTAAQEPRYEAPWWWPFQDYSELEEDLWTDG